MTIEFLVIGELKDDPGHFLLRDDVGQCYDYNVAMDEIIPIEVDGSWAVDVDGDTPIVVEPDNDRVAS